jgi:signal transduction histidine kinase
VSVRGIGRAYERRLELQVRERTRALEAAHAEMLRKARLATIGQTASVLAHEMRNPLASIKLALSGVKGSDGLDERARRRVELVAGEVDRLDGLLRDTLDHVRPVQLSHKPVKLEDLLTGLLRQEEPLLRRRGLRVRRERCAQNTALRLDENKLHQALLNLLKNAAEASPAGEEIRMGLHREAGDAVLEIANRGEPLSAEVLARAFDPFFTTKPRGSGLGLGLVKRVVEEHGGTVALASDAAHGTRVTVRLPLS